MSISLLEAYESGTVCILQCTSCLVYTCSHCACLWWWHEANTVASFKRKIYQAIGLQSNQCSWIIKERWSHSGLHFLHTWKTSVQTEKRQSVGLAASFHNDAGSEDISDASHAAAGALTFRSIFTETAASHAPLRMRTQLMVTLLLEDQTHDILISF